MGAETSLCCEEGKSLLLSACKFLFTFWLSDRKSESGQNISCKSSWIYQYFHFWGICHHFTWYYMKCVHSAFIKFPTGILPLSLMWKTINLNFIFKVPRSALCQYLHLPTLLQTFSCHKLELKWFILIFVQLKSHCWPKRGGWDNANNRTENGMQFLMFQTPGWAPSSGKRCFQMGKAVVDKKLPLVVPRSSSCPYDVTKRFHAADLCASRLRISGTFISPSLALWFPGKF